MHGAIALKKTITSEPHPQISYRSGPLWFAAFTNPKCEIRAQLGLMSLGYRAFVPKMRKWISHARVKKAVERPLAPRYVFFELEPEKHGFADVRNTDGIEYIIGTDGVPMPMPQGFIPEFIRRQMAGEWDFVAKDEEGNPRPLPKGARVCIMDGQYEDLFAIVIGRGKRSGGEILAKILERRTVARFSQFSVRPA